ncbi:aminotransferase class V-fold PLP-dependent enzyme [Chitinophaga sp. sic0106]|uniref:aminotransferase class V-fold PLP-dependent enzyme n=1 Tax=Chitinophaga sp. sic0106 TaxID=2854785 RepID=UPI001C45BB36|nr:aminotransferase class V-fold PLP-dependent enzyme [Chitinophaga sp. sic0106]MBV7534004.1 aminotransferase class V-fold PLP-dependent enzyme [Chitinophaga sp. sic0106]
MDLNLLRRDTPGCSNVIHLNNAGASLIPKPVQHAMQDYLVQETDFGGYETADKYAPAIMAFYDQAATLLNTRSSNIAYATSATDAYNLALSAVPFKNGDVVLLTENDYPSNFITLLSLQKRYGIRLELVKNTPSGEIDLEDLENKIKQHRPVLVSVTHVPTSSGLVQPVAAIGDITTRLDTLFLLDACQSLGQLPVDALAIKADFISGTLRKFLRGPRGAGLLYVSDKVLHAGLEPLMPDMRGADWTSTFTYQARKDAKRFELWEKNYMSVIGSATALKYANDIGIQAIANRNEILCGFLRKELASVPGVQLMDRGAQPCSIVTFAMQGRQETGAKQYFRDRGINLHTTTRQSAMIDFEEKGVDWVLRVSPHYYNVEEELERFVEVLQEW